MLDGLVGFVPVAVSPYMYTLGIRQEWHRQSSFQTRLLAVMSAVVIVANGVFALCGGQRCM